MHDESQSMGEFLERRLKSGDPITVYVTGQATGYPGFFLTADDTYLFWINTGAGSSEVTNLVGISVTSPKF